MKGNAWMVTVTGKDRPGIIAAVTKMLYQHKGNLEDISMTILEGQFAMMLVACTPSGARAETLKKALSALAQKNKLVIQIQKLTKKLVRGDQHQKGAKPYILSLIGKDQTGIVSRITDYMASSRLNITDLNSKLLGRGKKMVYALVLEVDIPKSVSVKSVESGLKRLAKKMKMDCHLRPAERIEF